MTEILSDEAVAELEKRIDSFPLSPIQARALCATVRHLRAEIRRLTKERDQAREDVRILTKGRFIQS